MGDYFNHWIAMGRKLTDTPGIFCVNWFRRRPTVAQETTLGWSPRLKDIDWVGSTFSASDFATLTRLIAKPGRPRFRRTAIGSRHSAIVCQLHSRLSGSCSPCVLTESCRYCVPGRLNDQG